jgi:hypothetical protein
MRAGESNLGVQRAAQVGGPLWLYVGARRDLRRSKTEEAMADSPDYRQMMNALDEAVSEALRSAFNDLYMSYEDEDARAAFSEALTSLIGTYTAAVSEIEKETKQTTADAHVDYRQLMGALDKAFAKTVTTAFGKTKTFVAAIPTLRNAYKTAVSEIEKKTKQLPALAAAESKGASPTPKKS